MVKQTSISVRLTDDLLNKFDAVTKIIPLGKSDFIRGCIEKLCDDNELLTDHSRQVDQYLEFIKKESSKLPENMVIVKNGSWRDVSNSTIIILCDELWRATKPVFSEWQKLSKKYGIEHEEASDFSDAEESDGLLGLGDIVMMVTKKTTSIDPSDISFFLEQQMWSDSTEINRISLSYAVKKAFEKTSAKNVVKKYLKHEETRKNTKPLRVVIDARGEFRRSGTLLYLPVDTEKIESTGKRISS